MSQSREIVREGAFILITYIFRLPRTRSSRRTMRVSINTIHKFQLNEFVALLNKRKVKENKKYAHHYEWIERSVFFFFSFNGTVIDFGRLP